MTLDRRLLIPRVTSTSIGVHDAAKPAYQIWSSLLRQFDAGSLSFGDQIACPLDLLHAIKDRRGCIHVFAGFDAYQALIPSLSTTKKSRVSILCYPDLEEPDIERLSLKWTVKFIKSGCLDRRSGLEMFRQLLDTLGG